VRGHRFGAAAIAATLVAALTGVFTALTAAPAAAHTTQNQGPYALTFGWMNEPCYTAAQNAVQLFVHSASPTGAPVPNIQGLQVVVSAGGVTSKPLALTWAYDPDTGLGNQAEYDAPLIPTIVGPYTFTITGTINGTKINVSATSSDSTFDSAHDPSAIEFPAQLPPAATLSASIDHLAASLRSETAAVNRAKSAASTARTIAIVAIVVAVVLAIVAIALGRRKTPAAG
jgi:hypothetical protein